MDTTFIFKCIYEISGGIFILHIWLFLYRDMASKSWRCIPLVLYVKYLNLETNIQISVIFIESSYCWNRRLGVIFFLTYPSKWPSFWPTEQKDKLASENVTVIGIYASCMSYLEQVGLREEFLKEKLMSLTWDGATVILVLCRSFKTLHR